MSWPYARPVLGLLLGLLLCATGGAAADSSPSRPTGRIVYLCDEEKNLCALTLGGKPERITRGGKGSLVYRSPSISLDGRWHSHAEL